jgi:hypothetical protein
VTRNERINRLIPEPKAWWQSVIAGEGLPNGRMAPANLIRRRKCEGTVEDHRSAALDVRELYRHGVFNLARRYRLGQLRDEMALATLVPTRFSKSRAGAAQRPDRDRADVVDAVRDLLSLLANLPTLPPHRLPALWDRRTVRLPALRRTVARLTTEERKSPEFPPALQDSAKARRHANPVRTFSVPPALHAPEDL